MTDCAWHAASTCLGNGTLWRFALIRGVSIYDSWSMTPLFSVAGLESRNTIFYSRELQNLYVSQPITSVCWPMRQQSFHFRHSPRHHGIQATITTMTSNDLRHLHCCQHQPQQQQQLDTAVSYDDKVMRNELRPISSLLSLCFAGWHKSAKNQQIRVATCH